MIFMLSNELNQDGYILRHLISPLFSSRESQFCVHDCAAREHESTAYTAFFEVGEHEL